MRDLVHQGPDANVPEPIDAVVGSTTTTLCGKRPRRLQATALRRAGWTA
jgi:hypothetical protein